MILITGADGFLGSHLRIKNSIRLTRNDVDLLDFKSLMKFMVKNKIDSVVHLAAKIFKNNEYGLENVITTFNILECCRILGVKRFIFASSSEASKLNNLYGLNKSICESICEFYHKKYGIKIIVLRFAGIWGKGKDKGAIYNFVQAAKTNKTLYVEDKTTDFLYIDDAINAIVLSLKKIDGIGYAVLNIDGEKQVKVSDIAKMIIILTKSKSKIKVTSEEISYKSKSLENNLKEYLR